MNALARGAAWCLLPLLSLAACSGESSPEVAASVGESGVVLWPQYGDFALESNKAVIPVANLRLQDRHEDADYLSRISATPQARWVGDFTWNESNSDRVGLVVRQARDQDAIGVIAISGDPGAECEIAPGEEYQASETYREFLEAVAEPMRGADVEVWVVVEPGALVSLGDCEGQGNREAMLVDAVTTMADAGYTIYVDLGGVDQLSAAEAATRLQLLPLEQVDGFALNVGGYRTVEDQREYGDAVGEGRDDNDVRGLGFIIDTSRNGVGLSDPDPCNPPGQAIGKAPRLIGDGNLDAYVWIKRPGESDGTCNGGSVSGQFWLAGALELARNGDPDTA